MSIVLVVIIVKVINTVTQVLKHARVLEYSTIKTSSYKNDQTYTVHWLCLLFNDINTLPLNTKYKLAHCV